MNIWFSGIQYSHTAVQPSSPSISRTFSSSPAETVSIKRPNSLTPDIYKWITLLSIWNLHNTVNELCVRAKLLHSCLTLCNPVDCRHPDSSVHGILQAGILEWVAMLSSRGYSPPRDQNCSSWLLRYRQIQKPRSSEAREPDEWVNIWNK